MIGYKRSRTRDAEQPKKNKTFNYETQLYNEKVQSIDGVKRAFCESWHTFINDISSFSKQQVACHLNEEYPG